MSTTKEIMNLIDAFAEEKRIEHVYASRDLSPVLRNDLLKAVEALVANAERYRWLRDVSGAEEAVANYWGDSEHIVDINDVAIDAAIKETK